MILLKVTYQQHIINLNKDNTELIFTFHCTLLSGIKLKKYFISNNGTCAFHGVPDVACRRVVQQDVRGASQVGCPWESNPTRSSDRTAAKCGWVVRPLVPSFWPFRDQAFPARGGKACQRGWSTPRAGQNQTSDQAIPATDGGGSPVWGARRDVHVVRTMTSEVPANKGRMPINDWS